MHDNVIDIARHVSPFPQASELYFPVAERRDGWQDKHGTWHVDPTMKKLVRVDGANKPVVLATVNTTYRVVKNRDLFEHVEQHMSAKFPANMLRDVTVSDQQAYSGRNCFRDYRFPSIKTDVDGRGDVSFRIIVGNGYGDKAIQLIVGGIDAWCSNGMIIGEFNKVVKKHTSGMTLSGLDVWLDGSIKQFTKHTERLVELSHTKIGHVHPALFKHLIDSNLFSERHARDMFEGMLRERVARSGRGESPTLWHLYSAMTRWATHDDIRDTGNDHGAVTRIERSKHVERVIAAASTFVRQQAA